MTEPTPQTENQKSSPDFERDLLERLAFETLEERRKTRRWNIFFRTFFAGYLLLILVLALVGAGDRKATGGDFTALVDLEGVIGPNEIASADNVISGLRAAFESNAKAIIIRANSPGGTTVQSAYISDEVRRLRKENPDIPVYGVIGDVCASGCYYVISGTNRIYASKSSIVGSIGVLMDGGFGFTEAMKKLGIKRRLFNAGEHKGSFDPFLPLSKEDRQHIKKMLKEVHDQFIDAVRSGRGKALKETPDIYSGRFWSGQTAKKLGLVDEFGNASYVAREVVKAERIVDFTFRPKWLDRFASRLGSSIGHALGSVFQQTPVTGTR